jgi:peroxidase
MGLATQHLLWMREHNRIENIMHQMNPHWDGEKLYQETRRLVTGMMQHVVYAEWLPIVLGPKIMERYGLFLKDSGYWNGWFAIYSILSHILLCRL